MKHLYILSSIYGSVNFTFEIDSIISDAKENEVTVLLCDQNSGKCSGNTIGMGLLCYECKKRTNAVLSTIKGLKVLKMSDYIEKGIIHGKYNYTSLKELNKIEYKGFEIGYGVSSYYISLTRNLNPKITPKLKRILDDWLECSMTYADVADKVITSDYDMVYVVNGRLFDSKPFQEIAFSKGIHVILGESTKTINGENVRNNFDNIRVHSVIGNTERILKFWDKSQVPIEERKEKAISFFERRANAIMTNDKIYVKDQKPGLMPDDWDDTKTNIVIFNSSEDEFAAIGGEWEKNNLFESQLAGIRYILANTIEPNIHFYLRVHPNLMHIPYKYHTDLYKLPDKFNNVTVIPGNSPVSSYSLMKACDRIVSFGSTMGVESAYAGKATMIMRPCMYYYLNVNYVPENEQDVMDFINGKVEFTPNHENTLKFSYYYYNDERRGPDNLECNLNDYVAKYGKKSYFVSSMNLNCSDFVMKCCAYLGLWGVYIAKKRIPTGEQ